MEIVLCKVNDERAWTFGHFDFDEQREREGDYRMFIFEKEFNTWRFAEELLTIIQLIIIKFGTLKLITRVELLLLLDIKKD